MSIKVSGRNRFDRTHIINLAESISLYILSLIQRKYVQTNRLCQVYYVCSVEAISPGHFDGHILFT